MEIPYTVSTRPDTGLWNAKVGIWLFLASEVMLFGGLFSAYIFLRLDAPPGMWPHGLLNVPNIKDYEVALDPLNADPTNPAMDRPHFFPLPVTDKIAKIEKEDVERATMFLPTHSAYFASYFTITGLHGMHVLGGVLVFIYMWMPVSNMLY